jgi:L-ascorbate metabolism protein UlaG (beta-lactamase superfamily)
MSAQHAGTQNEAVITLIGGPTAIIEIGGMRLLTDPTFDDPQAYEGGGGRVRLVKNSAPAVLPAELPPIDAVLLSHDQHLDNLDHAGRAFLPKAGKVLTTPVGAQRLGGNAQGMEPWQNLEMTSRDGVPLMITAVPARHGPHGIEPISGDVTGFVISIGADGPGIYISGDTVWFDGVAEIAKRFDIRVAILFTGSARPRGAFHMTMDSNDAIEAAHAFGRATVVTIHNEGWEHFTETQAELAGSFAVVGLSDRLMLLERGVPASLRL